MRDDAEASSRSRDARRDHRNPRLTDHRASSLVTARAGQRAASSRIATTAASARSGRAAGAAAGSLGDGRARVVPVTPAEAIDANPRYVRAATDRPLLKELAQVLRARRYALRTEQTYVDWCHRFLLFLEGQPGFSTGDYSRVGKAQVQLFLSHLAVERQVSASTQNQALNEAGASALLEALLCSPSAAGGVRHPHGAGAVGAQGRGDDDDLHAGAEPAGGGAGALADGCAVAQPHLSTAPEDWSSLLGIGIASSEDSWLNSNRSEPLSQGSETSGAGATTKWPVKRFSERASAPLVSEPILSRARQKTMECGGGLEVAGL